MKDMMRKRNFKRKTAFLLALSMVCSFPNALTAEAVLSNIGVLQKNIKTVSEENNGIEENNSKINIKLSSALVFNESINFKVGLTCDDCEYSESQDTVLAGSGGDTISFDNLKAGEYILRVTADGFADYTQSIEVADNEECSLKLTVGFCEGYEYVEGEGHPGVIMTGDVDRNGVIDDNDKKILIDVIDSGEELQEYVTDLNRDGKTNLIDLIYFTKSYKTDKDTASLIDRKVSNASIRAEVQSNVYVEGDIKKVINGSGKESEAVTFSPAGSGCISKENSVSFGFNLGSSGKPAVVDGITIETPKDNPIKDAFVDIECIENGEEHTVTVPVEDGVEFLLKESDVRVTRDANGNIQLHLGEQIAVKKVTFTITAMQNDNNLAKISKVEFVNGMEERMPEPSVDIPEDFVAEAGSGQISLSWNPCINITGYEVRIKSGNAVETVMTDENSIVLTTFNKKEIKNYSAYEVSVQAVNASWKSGYCDTVKVTPMPTKRPDKPDSVSAYGKNMAIDVRWAAMDDTQTYNVFYKLKNSDEEYTQISGITSNKYTLTNLKDLAEYEIYVTGVNHLGESPASIHCAAATTDINPAEVPKYNIINRDEKGVPGSEHIVSVTRNGASMVKSPLDEGFDNTAWGVVDGNASSYYSKGSWDDGGFNNLGNSGLIYTFDDYYEIGQIAMLATDGMQFSYVKVRYWDENGNAVDVKGASTSKTTDSQGRVYHVITLPYAITTNKIQIGLARYLSSKEYHLITVSETYFYSYDHLKDEVYDIYADSLHLVLKDYVTEEVIEKLRAKVNTPDEYGEENTNKTAYLKELDWAEKILSAKALSDAVEIHTRINVNNENYGFSGLNGWQPLGISAACGDTITVYVASNIRGTGTASGLQLVSTQYHSESSNVLTANAYNLKVGANVINLPKKVAAGSELGGALYIQCVGANLNEKYSVRVDGGTHVPVLDLYKVTDENERMERTVEYINELDNYVPKMESLHNKVHKNATDTNVAKCVAIDYDPKNCILGASDILLDTMMLSLPAQQILAGAGNGTVEERAKTMLDSMDAMEEMMYLFYQHKGLNSSAPSASNQIPKQHLNIRYQRMFSGAFMYAAGNHIGIEWGSTSSLMRGVPIESDENGRYISGNYFGWGIAHEIGHNINQGTYAVAEITNNYFAQLAQAKDTNAGMRFKYKNIYDKVTSGTKGDCSNIATQLGMYWQLHLAYDSGLNYKTYPDYTEQLANLFYARVDTYARNAEAAPSPKGIKLALSGDKNQDLMRLSCAAANKNVLEFFERWGKIPNSATIEYAEQFEKETRAIFYANDDSRVYALEGEGSVLGTESSVSAIKNVSVNIGKAPNKVEFKFTSENVPENDILGYEIIRCTISGGKTEEIPVGFTESTEFTDTVSTMNNRTVFYKITLIDKYLNRSEVYTTKMLKIEHDGSMDKKNWTVNAAGLTAETTVIDSFEDEMQCEKAVSNPAEQAVDNNLNTVYTPQVNGNSAEIVINFNKTVTATGFKYTAGDGTPVGDYRIYVKSGEDWILTADGTFNGNGTVYFANDADEYISTYSTTAVKLEILNQKGRTLSIAELDVLGVTGDNVDFRRDGEEKSAVIGILESDYKYGDKSGDVIPKDSLVFTGSYKGNPAYNVVILYDADGNIVSGFDSENNRAAQQIILADVPEKGNIANVSDGTWIYWIEPEQMKDMELPETVRVELYRVNNALTNEGQRLVSDSLFEELPDKLPSITFGK